MSLASEGEWGLGDASPMPLDAPVMITACCVNHGDAMLPPGLASP